MRDYVPQRPICCATCGRPGGTLVKKDDKYYHQDPTICRRNRRQAEVDKAVEDEMRKKYNL